MTCAEVLLVGVFQIAIHAPRVGRDPDGQACRVHQHISIHAPRVGRDTFPAPTLRERQNFNPRARVGRDLRLFASAIHQSHFNPRARVGRDSLATAVCTRLLNFNPRARVGRDAIEGGLEIDAADFNPRARVGRDGACLHGLNYSGRVIFFANLIFGRAVTGIFRRKVLCVIRVRTEILRPFSRRRCLLQHQSSFSFITWFCTDVLRFSCVFIS